MGKDGHDGYLWVWTGAMGRSGMVGQGKEDRGDTGGCYGRICTHCARKKKHKLCVCILWALMVTAVEGGKTGKREALNRQKQKQAGKGKVKQNIPTTKRAPPKEQT